MPTYYYFKSRKDKDKNLEIINKLLYFLNRKNGSGLCGTYDHYYFMGNYNDLCAESIEDFLVVFPDAKLINFDLMLLETENKKFPYYARCSNSNNINQSKIVEVIGETILPNFTKLYITYNGHIYSVWKYAFPLIKLTKKQIAEKFDIGVNDFEIID